MITPYFMFPGNAREVMAFYKEAFGASESYVETYGEMPEGKRSFPVEPGMEDLILHGTIEFKGEALMFSDSMPSQEFTVGNNLTLAVGSSDEAFIRHAYEVLTDGGEIHMELGPTFWSPLYANVTDKYGTQWQLNFDERK